MRGFQTSALWALGARSRIPCCASCSEHQAAEQHPCSLCVRCREHHSHPVTGQSKNVSRHPRPWGVDPSPVTGLMGHGSFLPSPAGDRRHGKKKLSFFKETRISFFHYEIPDMTSFPSLPHPLSPQRPRGGQGQKLSPHTIAAPPTRVTPAAGHVVSQGGPDRQI